MVLKQAAAYVHEDELGEILQENSDAPRNVFALLAGCQALLKEVCKKLKAVLVHWIYSSHVSHHKVDDGCTSCHRSEGLGNLVDLVHALLCRCHALLAAISRLLGLVQCHDELV